MGRTLLTMPHLHSTTNRQDSEEKPAKSLQLLAVIMFAVILVVALQRISIQQPLKPGDQAPVLTLKKLPVGAVSLADFYHKPLAVLFFSANCPHCKTELRNIERLRNTFNGIVQFLLVSRSDQASTGALMDSLGMVIPVAIDEVGRASEKFGVFKVPALFLIDKNGIIQLTSFGEHSLDARKEQLESFLEALATEAIKPANLKRQSKGLCTRAA